MSQVLSESLLDAQKSPALAERKLWNTSISSVIMQAAFVSMGTLTSVFLARSLGTSTYGVYSYLLALVNILVIISQVGLPSLLVRELPAYINDGSWGFLRGLLRRATSVALVITITVFTLITSAAFAGVRLGPAEPGLLFLSLFLLPVVALNNIRGAAMRGLHHVILGQFPEQVIRPLFLLGSLALYALLSKNQLTVHVALLCNLVAALVAFAMGTTLLVRQIPSIVKQSSPCYDDRRWSRIALTMALTSGMATVASQTDIIMLGLLGSKADVGVYRIAALAANLIPMGMVAITAAMAPRISASYHAKDSDGLRRTVRTTTILSILTAIPFTLAFIVAPKEIISYVLGDAYSSGAIPLAILALGNFVLVMAGPSLTVANMSGNERLAALATALLVIMNIILNAIAIPLWGATGSAVATACSQVAMKIFLTSMLKRRLT